VAASVFLIHYVARNYRGQPDRAVASGETASATEDASHEPATEELTSGGDAFAPVPKRKVAKLPSADAEGQCVRVEYPGDGPTLTRISAAEWGGIVKLFHASKSKLTGYLNARRSELGAKEAGIMAAQLRALKIARPPIADEPDLAWRGLGVFARESRGVPASR
jgi:hypothetical protein